MIEKKIWLVNEVAEYLRVSKETVIRLIKSNKLKGIKIGTQWRIKEEDFLSYLNEQAKK